MHALRRLMYANGWTQAAFAKELKVVPSTVSLWLAGKTLPSPSRIRRMSQLLRIDAMSLTKLLEPEFTLVGSERP